MTGSIILPNIVSGKNKIDIFFLVAKISIIVFVAIWFIGNFMPFYSGADSKLYGVTAIDLVNGEFGFSNELLSQTGNWEFIPNQYVKTVHNTAIPIGNFGIYGISAIAYSIGGLYGLFYLGPLMAIFLLISSERIATNLFGRGAGLVTLLIISTDFTLLQNGLNLLTDLSFALFFILGCFCLIKFLQTKRDLFIILCSIFFVTSMFLRLNGIVAFPLEILLILGYLGFQIFSQTKNESNHVNIFIKTVFSKTVTKDFVKKSFLLFIPWILFLIFLISYNDYFFGDPLTFYNDVSPDVEKLREESRSSFFTFDLNRFEWIKFYLSGILPDEIFDNVRNLSIETKLWSSTYNWIGIISLAIFALGLGVSLIKKDKRIEIIILSLFALSFPLFHSASYLHDYNYIDAGASFQTGERYMILPSILLAFVIGYLIQKFWRLYLTNNRTPKPKKTLVFRAIFFLTLGVFFLISINDSPPIDSLKSSSFEIRNPQNFIDWYPVDNEGMPEKSIIVGSKLRRGIEYDAVLFNPFWEGFDRLALDKTPQSPIQLLKESINLGYDVYTFRDIRFTERAYLKYLVDEHGFVINDYSKTFCKLDLIENNNQLNNFTNTQSFNTCLILKIIN